MAKLREEKRFLAKRERLMANGWRHGVTGVDDPDHPASHVYRQKQHQKRSVDIPKEFIKAKREKDLFSL